MVITEKSMLGRFLIWIGLAKPYPPPKINRHIVHDPWKETFYR